MKIFDNFIKFKKKKKDNSYDKSKLEILQYLPSENITMLEAGASNGLDTIEWANILNKAKIYAIEPVPFAYSALKQRVKSCKNVETFNVALNDITSEVDMYLSTGIDKTKSYGASSLLKPTEYLKNYHSHLNFDKKIKVKTVNLDEWADNNNIEKIDFMWLDMQGAEYKVLKAAPKILETVKVIYTEVLLTEIYENAPLYPQYKKFLLEQGFELLKEDLEWENAGNLLFIKNNR